MCAFLDVYTSILIRMNRMSLLNIQDRAPKALQTNSSLDTDTLEEEYLCIDILRNKNLIKFDEWKRLPLHRLSENPSVAIGILAACFAKNIPWVSVSFENARNCTEVVSDNPHVQ